MNLILIATNGLDEYPLETARILIRLSMDWAKRAGVAHRAILLSGNRHYSCIAGEYGIKTIEPGGGDILQNLMSLLSVSNCQGIILAPASQPFREHWLLKAVERKMSEYPFRKVATRIIHQQGSIDACQFEPSLLGFPLNMLDQILSTRKWRHADDISILQNAESCFDGKYPTEELPNEQSIMMKAREIHLFHPPVQLPEQVAIVGSSNSILGSRAGGIIDAQDAVIRVNWARTKGFEKDVGTRMDYHATKYFQTLREAKTTFPDSKSVAMRWFLSKDPKRWMMFDYGVTPIIEEHAKHLISNATFISTGLFTIIWALNNGAVQIMIAGYGGNKHLPKINYYNSQFDGFASKNWKLIEDELLDQFRIRGALIYLD